MSHYTCLIIGDNPEKQLAPFQENNMGDCPKKYLEFKDLEEEYAKDYEEGTSSEGDHDFRQKVPIEDVFRLQKEKGKYEFVHEPDIMSLNKGIF